jgi:hypothetical protein
MIDMSILKSLGWSEDLIEAARAVAEETNRAVTSRSDIEIYGPAECSVETTTRIDLTMAPEVSVWPRLS